MAADRDQLARLFSSDPEYKLCLLFNTNNYAATFLYITSSTMASGPLFFEITCFLTVKMSSPCFIAKPGGSSQCVFPLTNLKATWNYWCKYWQFKPHPVVLHSGTGKLSKPSFMVTEEMLQTVSGTGWGDETGDRRPEISPCWRFYYSLHMLSFGWRQI